MKSTNIKSKLARLLWDIPAVVIAVLLALALNTWKENNSEKAAAKESLKAIFEEMKDNKESLDGFLKNNRVFHSSMMQVRDSMERIGIDELARLRLNFDFIVLSSAAWDTSLKKEIGKHYSSAVIRDLAKLYNIQGFISNLLDMQLQKITSLEFHSSSNNIHMVEAHIELLQVAISLAETYQEGEVQLMDNYLQLVNQ